MWGGEIGDSTPCLPVFIGPYWDVLLQSQNCWDMLQFVRPWRGIRMMWVDTICMNQRNLEKRTSQVSHMRHIYGEGSRVVVYLGDDVVTDLGRFPVHLNLGHINSAPSYGDAFEKASVGLVPKIYLRSERIHNLEKLSSRAYFGRVWVIQELIASEQAVLRIGNNEFKADAGAMFRISLPQGAPFNWSQTRAPWVQYLGQKKALIQEIQKMSSV
ncbi:hypothetical protein CC86DRAFT_127194 [Ophiobolus disseminans]|uniref:Heterokaryon incompatibility domain-containing protein n=1 Tax=Ophiobolus disseminans TaxID=1469910 RepID=A0A6A6ZHK8_9PLEO|nr:hypothetical protein CC86DRAFT_127194 [Ophiobolus disseminans]